jgi:hypothetical protein
MAYSLDQLVHGFQVLSVRAALKEDITADLDKAVEHVVMTVKATAPSKWQEETKKVRGRMRFTLAGLEIPEAILPNKLIDPANIAQRAFYQEAIARLDAVIATNA